MKSKSKKPGPPSTINEDDAALFEATLFETQKLDRSVRDKHFRDPAADPDADPANAPAKNSKPKSAAPNNAETGNADSASEPPTPLPATPLPETPLPAPPQKPTFEVVHAKAGDSFAGLDKRNAQRLKRGQMKIEARLDLHGMTQVEAHRSLREFVPRSVEAGKRCVLVITGKGSPRDREGTDRDGGFMPDRNAGVLRSQVPKWLGGVDLRPHIIRFEEAIPKHGGSGALYLLLRRRRTK